MNITIPNNQKAAYVLHVVNGASSDSTLCCSSEREFALVKIALVKSQRVDLSIQLLDAKGVLLKHVTPRLKSRSSSS